MTELSSKLSKERLKQRLRELPREQWLATLSRVPEPALEELVAGFPSNWIVQAKTLPQSGLGMLKMRDTALGEAFYMGEFPLSNCWVSIRTEDGHEAEGAAWIMDDRAERAEQMALCDAVLSARLPGWEQVEDLLEIGLQVQEDESRERKSLLAKTRVDFSLLDDAGDDNA
ncbi:MAG: alpha-D-ribose 1-methylphosphonate 5-triphosphate synthase subunit PhnG [Oleiphilaceae bacterium]|jgi:alpha-D-ribose 1-methylphosphonate 5-triphosphate synthase subunit PhnG